MSKVTSSSAESGIVFVAVLITLALVGLGVGATYYFTDGFGRNKPTESAVEATTDATPDQTDQVNESATGQDTLALVKLAVKGKGSVKCTADSKVEGKYAISTIYIKDKDHFRLEVRSDMGTVNTLMLNQKTGYTWADGQKTGTKITLGRDDKTIEQQWQENIDYANDNPGETESDTPRLSCGQTAVDDELFILPKGVEFSDLSPHTVN